MRDLLASDVQQVRGAGPALAPSRLMALLSHGAMQHQWREQRNEGLASIGCAAGQGANYAFAAIKPDGSVVTWGDAASMETAAR